MNNNLYLEMFDSRTIPDLKPVSGCLRLLVDFKKVRPYTQLKTDSIEYSFYNVKSRPSSFSVTDCLDMIVLSQRYGTNYVFVGVAEFSLCHKI